MNTLKDLNDMCQAGHEPPDTGEFVAGPGYIDPESELGAEPEGEEPPGQGDESEPDQDAHRAARRVAPLGIEDPERPEHDPELAGVLAIQSNERDATERVLPVTSNVVAILTADQRLRGRLRRDLLSLVDTCDGERVTDELETAIACWLGLVYGVHVAVEKVHQAVQLVSSLRPFHPVRDYLSALRWDGVRRLDSWLTTYAGVDDEGEAALVRAYGAKWLISAVARAFEPGCKVDHVLVLGGPKGLRKSSTFAVLGGAWFGDSALPIGEKDAYQLIVGKWIWELAELDSVSRRELGAVKAYITSQRDSFRPSYGRNPIDLPRQVVFAGTVNSDSEPVFLREPDRRWWVVRVTQEADTDALRRDRDQLLAEAVRRYRAKEPWWLDTDDLEAAQHESVSAYVSTDTWEALIGAYAANHSPVTVEEVLKHACNIEPSKASKADAMRAAGVLSALGWTRRRRRLNGVNTWFWSK